MEVGENHEPPRFCIEVRVPRGGRKIAVLRLHHGATLEGAVEATVDLHYKRVCFVVFSCSKTIKDLTDIVDMRLDE